MKTWFYALCPLGLLLLCALPVAAVGYFLLQGLGDFMPLSKLISKGTLLLLVLSIFPIRAYLKLNWQDLGFVAAKPFFKQTAQGLLFAVMTLAPLLLLLYALDVHVFDEGRRWTVLKLSKKISLALLVAVAVAVVEELIFRGLLLASLKRNMAACSAMLVSAAYYASLHFLKTPRSIPYADLQWHSGFELLVKAFAQLLNPDIIGAWLALFAVGWVLAILRSELKYSLGLCIGCHAGWVWQIKISKEFLNANPHSDYLYLVSGYDDVVGGLMAAWLLFAIAVYQLWKRYRLKPA